MRSIKTYLVVALISITALNAVAQAPGYLGKRFIVNYNIYTLPALSNYNENGKTGISAFNTRHVISVDWVTGLKQSAGLSVHFTKTQFDFKRTLSYENYSSGYLEIYDLDYGDTRGELSAFAIGLHTNLYLNEFIAPLGTYFKPEILLINFRATFDSTEAKENLIKSIGHTLTTYPVLANKTSYTTLAIGATIGTHYIFFDRLILDIGFQLGYVFGGKKMGELMASDGVTNKKITEDNYISVSAKSRLMSQYFINVNAGLGILIF